VIDCLRSKLKQAPHFCSKMLSGFLKYLFCIVFVSHLSLSLPLPQVVTDLVDEAVPVAVAAPVDPLLVPAAAPVADVALAPAAAPVAVPVEDVLAAVPVGAVDE
jgi:hypothetical protein